MTIQIADFYVCIIQIYIFSNFVCRINKMKYGYLHSICYHMMLMVLQYIIVSWGTEVLEERVILGVAQFIIGGILLFDGSLFYKIRRGLFCAIVYIGLDLLCYFVFYRWVPVSIAYIALSANIVLARNLYNITVYLLVVILELFLQRKEETKLRIVVGLTIALAGCQIVIMKYLIQVNADGILNHILVLTILYSGIVILGYFITMEMFYQLIRQQRKQNDLEQKMLEKQYQYNYYKLAYTQGEELRDIRHDMKNQLQAMDYLLYSRNDEDRKTAEKMLKNLTDKMTNAELVSVFGCEKKGNEKRKG